MWFVVGVLNTSFFECDWFITVRNLSLSSKQQLVDCDTVDSASNGDLVDNGLTCDKKSTTCVRRPVTATPQQRMLASFELYCGHHPRKCHGIQVHVQFIVLVGCVDRFMRHEARHGVLVVGYGTDVGTHHWEVKSPRGTL